MTPQPAPTANGGVTRVRRKPPRLLWIAVAALATIAAGAIAWQTRTLPIQAVTVRPFASEGGPEWLAGAITEEITDALRAVTQAEADPMYAAVLEGSVARSGDRIRIVATLTRGDGHRYWTRTIDKPLVDIARETAAAIVPAARKRAPKQKPAAAAYEHYLKARQHFAGREFAAAVDGFDAAAAADPNFALAFAWAALAREHLAEQGTTRPNDLLPAARDDAERATTLAPDTAEPHLALAIVKLQYDWEWDVASQELDRAMQLSPRDPLVLHWRERWLEAMNRAPASALNLPNIPRDPESARQLLALAEGLRSQTYVTPLQFALAANVAHDTDSLFYWLGVAYDERSVQLPYLLRSPALPQTDPRLRELIQRLKLPANP
jgi:tetratricopeptide (TPR) repeat protein